MKFRFAGINIENGRAKASVAVKSVFSRRVRQIGSLELELPDQAPERTEKLKKFLLELKEKFGIQGIIFGLEQKRFSSHFLEMPKMAGKDIRGALIYELEKYLPLMPEEYIFDFASSGAISGKCNLFVLAIRSEITNLLAQSATEAGLKLIGIKNTFAEVLNQFISLKKPVQKTVFIMAGKPDFNVALIEGDQITQIRSVPLEEAQEMAVSKDRDGWSVYISGAQPFNQLSKFKNIPFDAAYCLAASVGGKRSLKFDFAPSAGKTDYEPVWFYSRITWVSAGLAVILYLLAPVGSYYKASSEYKKIELNLDGFRKKAAGPLRVKSELKKINHKEKFLYAFKAEGILPTRALSELSSLIPSDTWLSSFAFDENDKVEIAGFSNKPAALLVGPLEKSKAFQNVEFSTPVVSRGGLERFSIQMEMQGITAHKTDAGKNKIHSAETAG